MAGRVPDQNDRIDPSKGGDAHVGDYSAFVLLGIDALGTLYVEADLARRPIAQIVADGVAHCQAFRPDAFGIEVNQFQDLLGDQFVAAFRAAGLWALSPWSIENRVNKQVRIRRLGAYLARRSLRFKTHSPATALLIEQLREFPVGDHDDGPDALEMAIRLAGEFSHARGGRRIGRSTAAGRMIGQKPGNAFISCHTQVCRLKSILQFPGANHEYRAQRQYTTTLRCRRSGGAGPA